MRANSLVSGLWHPAWRLPEIGWGDVALAALLSLWAIGLTCGVFKSAPHSGVAAAILVLAMTVPVAWERRAPLAAALRERNAELRALELDVVGPVGRHADPVTALAVARERVALLGGSLRIDTHPGRWAALVRLPLTADYARP